MLEFQKQILTELVDQDALLILARGLGLFNILCSFLDLHTKDNHLVLVINTTQAQDAAIIDYQAAMGLPSTNHMQTITAETPAETRSNMYRQSGIFSVTSRILGVDMLLERVPISMISGIIVYNAHRIRPDSMEELILRIYRKGNEQGFIKAMSDQPESFTTGFAPLQNTLKTLQLRHVHLWPRFQVLVADNLSKAKADVVELRQPMTEKMDQIQQGLVECMEATLSEVRRHQSAMVDVEEFTIENSFFKSFDAIIRRQLDPIWHRVSPATKQLVGDLKILRQLLSYLADYDAVSFYSFLETVIASNSPKDVRHGQQSQWLFLDAAERAISAARRRLYVRPKDPEYQTASQTTIKEGNTPIRLILEEQPKWHLLREVLDEIEQDLESHTKEGAPVLIMVKERRTIYQLQEYISGSVKSDAEASPLLERLIRRFFSLRKSITNIQEQQQKEQQQKHQQSTPSQSSNQRGGFARGSAPPNKRRRVRGGSVAASSSSSRPPLAETFKDDVQETIAMLDTPTDTEIPIQVDDEVELGEDDILPKFKEIPVTSIISIQCYEDDRDAHVLEELQPLFVIMYDPDPTFIRRLEIYRASHQEVDIRVYFMLYENSVEEQNYLSMIRKEKEAFEKLIREKSIMAIPMPQRKNPQQEQFARAISSRIAGGQIKDKGPPTIIVDMREFRSSLPPILYAEDVKIVPCTLQIGDYVLSPDMCVERKSISDLISSFSSGRLYTQCENMCLHYKTPILLIEFDEGKSFSLQNLSDMKDTIVATDLSSKLVLLTLTFPKVKLIWSSSPHETAAVFKELKRNEDEPNADVAMMVGAENADDPNQTHNMTPQEILRSMPGVDSKNYKLLINAVENLEQLFALSESDIAKIIGAEPGRKLYKFIHQKAG
ncbi:mus38-like protein [Lichtheimia corymbifera JMRC:FSU:9682]|uniref:Mus38-like protein n=1 Tax=Lichtheimia corymbifera JMRC:FSU:9682 TaxID=1263082 RepID=A0A068RGM6_9FUNG|nr:mus38-like protein [Lichtheimia corymbifera JMRC:FSU:9682]